MPEPSPRRAGPCRPAIDMGTTMAFHPRPAAPRRRPTLALALLLGTAGLPQAGQAQTADSTAGEASTQKVTVTAVKSVAGISGFGNVPLSSLPMQVGVTTAEQFKDLGIRRLSDIAKIDASVGDGYNADGYWDFLTVRGFVLDNRFNYRRDGLPISAETSIPLDNKSRIEVLKGTSGMLSGIGSPGGMVNFVVKRPTDAALREAFVGWRQNGSVLASTDLSDRFGDGRAFGLRLNAAYEHLDPQTYDAEGSRYLLALAGDWRVNADTLLEAEVENSRRTQPSVPGFSVLGSVVPEPGNPRINLNNQPWSQPSVFEATTASLRWRQRLDAQWSLLAQAATQQLKSDDNIAFPYGCSAEGIYDRYLQRRHLRPVRLPQRERAAAQQRRRRVAERHAADRPTEPRADRRPAGQQGEQPIPGPGLQLRRHRQRAGHADHAARTRPRERGHQRRDALHRGLPARRHRLRRMDHAVAGPALHAPDRQRRQRRHPLQPGLHRAVAVAEPQAARRHAALCQLGRWLRGRRRTEQPALRQPRTGAAGAAQPAGGTRHQGRHRPWRVVGGGLRHRAAGVGRLSAAATWTTAAPGRATAMPCTAAWRPHWPRSTAPGTSPVARWRCRRGARAAPTPA